MELHAPEPHHRAAQPNCWPNSLPSETERSSNGGRASYPAVLGGDGLNPDLDTAPQKA